MRKVFLIIVFSALSLPLFCQKDTTFFASDRKKNVENKENRPVVIRDRLTFDIFHTFWMGAPAEGNFMKKFDPGFTVTAMWDFKIPQSQCITFGLGVGFTMYTQYSNCILMYSKNDDISKYFLIPSSVKYKHSRMAYMNCSIPFEIRYRHKSGFKLSLGVHVGLICGLSHRYKGNNYEDTSGEYLRYTNRNFKNQQKFSADVFVRAGWKAIGVFYCYQINKVFTDGKGPKMNPMSIGISISLF